MGDVTREIKFRAWVDNKRMIDNDWMKLSDWTYFDMVEGKLGILMQYTGLKDKNGVEIYEGDIIEIEGYSLFEIIYNAPSFKALWKNRNNLEWDLDTPMFCGGIVIGNIYENKELLNG